MRRLQLRVKQLEQELKRYQSAIIDATQAQQSADGPSIGTSTLVGQQDIPSHTPGGVSAAGFSQASPAELANAAAGTSPESLETGVQLLSLEAVAERYLGSSSGLTFARLTQAVLRRLKPDFEPFSFTDGSQDPPAAVLSTDDSDVSEPAARSSEPPLPLEQDAYRLAEFYWYHSHTLYPFLRKEWFMENLRRIYADPSDPLMMSHSWLYTMWMVFAIGSTSLSSLMLSNETESVQYWRNAMSHFDQTLQGRNMVSIFSYFIFQTSTWGSPTLIGHIN